MCNEELSSAEYLPAGDSWLAVHQVHPVTAMEKYDVLFTTLFLTSFFYLYWHFLSIFLLFFPFYVYTIFTFANS